MEDGVERELIKPQDSARKDSNWLKQSPCGKMCVREVPCPEESPTTQALAGNSQEDTELQDSHGGVQRAGGQEWRSIPHSRLSGTFSLPPTGIVIAS